MGTGSPTAQEHGPVEASLKQNQESKVLLVSSKSHKKQVGCIVEQEKKGGGYSYDRLAGINNDIVLSCPQQTAKQLMPGQAGFMDKGTSSHSKCILSLLKMNQKALLNELHLSERSKYAEPI